MLFQIRLVRLLVVLVAVLSGPVLCHGDETSVFTPGITLNGAYDDNVSFSNRSDFVTKITPRLSYVVTDERNTLQTSASVNRTDYLNNVENSRYDYNLSAKGQHQFTELIGSNLQVTYNRSSAFEDVLAQEGIVVQESTINRYGVSPGMVFSLTPRDVLNVYYSLSIADYTSSTLFSSTSHTVGSSYEHTLDNELTTLVTNLSYTQTDYSRTVDNSETDEQSIMITQGVRHSFTERLSVKGNAGIAYQKDDSASDISGYIPDFTAPDLRRFVTERLSNTSDSFMYLFDANVRYVGEVWAINAGGSRSLSSAGSQGQRREQYEFTAGLSYNVTERCSTSLNTRMLTTSSTINSQSDNNDKSRTTIDISPSVGYSLTEDMKTKLGFTHSTYDDEAADTNGTRLVTYLEFSWDFPIH